MGDADEFDDEPKRRKARSRATRGWATELKGKRPSEIAEKLAEVPGPQRVHHALQLFDEGKRYNAVREALMKKFGIARSTAEEDIKRAYEVIREEDVHEVGQIKARISAMQWRIAGAAFQAGEFGHASSALGRLAKLHGVDAPSKLEIDGIDPNQLQLLKALAMTPAERQRRLAELDGTTVEDVLDAPTPTGLDEV